MDDTENTCDVEMVADDATLETFTFKVLDGVVGHQDILLEC